MPRLFTAIEIPESMRVRLSLLRAPLPAAKWIAPENMHITLRFAGDIDARTADEFADQLAQVRFEPFTIKHCRRRRVRRPWSTRAVGRSWI
jgi:2'-5' RNA ligase